MELRRQALESQYETLLEIALKDPINETNSLAQLVERLKDLRQICLDLVIGDILYAVSKSFEIRLWSAHSRVNTEFRKQLVQLRKPESAGPVELHKFTKRFLSFLKDSQRFYRQFIQTLNEHYGAVPELQQIAQIEAAGITDLNGQPPAVRLQTLLSCYRTLIYLGDLSRYRAAEKLEKDSAWGPAVGYYTLATTLRPTSGMAFHQLSVIALEESDHLRAIYYLYRAIVVDEPHPNALKNLELEFRKVRRSWDNGADLPRHSHANDSRSSRRVLSAWFVRLHCLCFRGQGSSIHAELQNEVQSRLERQLLAQNADATAQRMCFINFAAQKTAADRFERDSETTDHLQSYLLSLSNNIKTMLTLLKLVSAEARSTRSETADGLSSTLQASLPLLRLYSAWLLTNSKILASDMVDQHISAELGQFWTNYAEHLSLLMATFPVETLPEVTYQLPEDVESFAFKPIESQNSLRRWFDGDNKLPECTKIGDLRLDASKEDLARIRGLLIDGLLLSVGHDDPMTFDGTKFLVKRNIVKSPAAEEPRTGRPPPGLKRQSKCNAETLAHSGPSCGPGQGEQETVRRMSEMVDELVGTDEDGAAGSLQPAATLARRLSALNTTPSQRPGSADSLHRMQSISSLWGHESPLQPGTPHNESAQRVFAHGSRTHSRVNSSSSLHSVASGQVSALASSFVPTPPSQAGRNPGRLSTDIGLSRLGNQALSGHDPGSGMKSPLLFGNGGVWSAKPRRSFQSDTPPAGQGG